MLFRPFRVRTWLKMGFIGWLAGGVVTASFNVRGPVFPRQFPNNQFPTDPFEEINKAIRSIHFEQLAGAVIVLAVLLGIGLVISLIFTYFFSRFRFILFDVVISGQVEIGRGWRAYRSPGNRYFGFWVCFNLLGWLVIGTVVGLPLWRAYKSGVFQGDQPFFAFLEVLASITLGVVAYAVIAGIVSTLVKDFIMPLMALDNLPMGQAFSVLRQHMAAEPGAWAGYFGMKLLLAFATGIALGVAGVFAFLMLFVVLLIPAGLLIWLGVFVLKASTALGVAVFVLTGLAVAAACFCLALCLAAPVSVFFAAYAFHFFGGRYPRLGALLWPEPTPPILPQPPPPGSLPATDFAGTV